MRPAKSRRGGALILVLMLVVIMAGIAESIVRVAHSRAVAYRATRDRLRSGIVARSALAELSECVGPAMADLRACAPAWSAWSCGSGTCTASRVMTTGPDDFRVSASWAPAGETLSVSVDAP